MEGLEISVVSFSKVVRGTATRRIDPEYFQKQYLADAELIVQRGPAFESFADLGLTVDASAFYPSIEEFYGRGSLPFVRVADVDGVIDFDRCVRIPEELCNVFPTLARIQAGDIVFTKGGSIARIGLLTQDAAASRDLIFLNTSTLPVADRVFLYLYAQTRFFRRQLVRSMSQTAQPHLTITLVRCLPILRAGQDLKRACVDLVAAAYKARDEAKSATSEAADLLAEVLEIDKFYPPDPLSYSRKFSDTLNARRLDAEFFRPRVDELRSKLEQNFVLKTLGSLGSVENGQTVPYSAEGEIPIIRSGDLSDIEDDTRFFRARSDTPVYVLEKGDVLVSSIGFGSIGKVQVFDKVGTYGTVSEVTVVRQEQVNPYYLASFLRSKVGQLQINRYITGTTGQLHLYKKDVRMIFVPIIGDREQKQFEKFAREAATAMLRSRELLGRAIRAAEIALEAGDNAALTFIDTNGKA